MKRITNLTAICAAAVCALSANAAYYDNMGKIVNFSHPPSIKLKKPPVLKNKDSFSILMLGDPQSYIKFDFTQPIFDLMTAWCAAQKGVLNVKTVICTGDLVEQNDIIARDGPPVGKNGNQPSLAQWTAVSNSFKRLDGVYPYVLTLGNHDYGFEAAEDRHTHFNEFFTVLRNPLWANHIAATCPNASGFNTLENAAYVFEDKNWGKIMIITLEFSPRNEVLAWADKIVNLPHFKNHKVIILTHSILSTNGEIIQKENYKVSPCNYPIQIWEKLIKKNANIKLVLCGHAGDTKTHCAFRKEKNDFGKEVPMMMFNPQAVGGWEGNGGDGWLRILEFMPDGKTIGVRTYSPLFAASARTQDLAWSTADFDEFEFEIQ